MGASRGRPSKLTPDVRERVCSLIREGNDTAVAAEAAGISVRTFGTWLERGEAGADGDESYVEFFEAVEKARAESEAARVETIAKSSSWQAAAWLLERRYPDRWGKPSARSDDAGKPESGGFFDELSERRERKRA